MADTRDLTNFNTDAQAQRQGQAIPAVSCVGVVSAEIDLEDYHNNKVALKATDILKLLRIPNGCVVLAAGAYCVRVPVASSTETLTLTMAGTPTNFVTSSTVKDFVPINAGTAISAGDGTMLTLAAPWVEPADDEYLQATIGTLAATPADFGKYVFFAVVAKVS